MAKVPRLGRLTSLTDPRGLAVCRGPGTISDSVQAFGTTVIIEWCLGNTIPQSENFPGKVRFLFCSLVPLQVVTHTHTSRMGALLLARRPPP